MLANFVSGAQTSDHAGSPLDTPEHLEIPDAEMDAGTDAESTFLTRCDAVARVRKQADHMRRLLHCHMADEEARVLPLFCKHLSPDEQGRLLVECMQATVSTAHLPDAFRLVSCVDLAGLFSVLGRSASGEDLRSIATAIAGVLSREQWTVLCENVDGLAKLVTPKHNPLIEITHLHKAFRKELLDIVSYCESMDIADQKQMQSLAARFEFLKRVHTCHSDGEEGVLLKELNVKLQSSPCSDAHTFHEDHDDETVLFAEFASRLSDIQEKTRKLSADPGHVLESLKKELKGSVQGIADHLIEHMNEEETKLLPLVRKHFSVEDQDRMMRRVMAYVPSEFLHELIPWVFGYLSVDEQESLLRSLLRSAPRDEIRKIVGAIAQSVKKGMTDRMEWNELCLRVPDIEVEYKKMIETDGEPDVGPVSEILRVHKAFRIELNALLRIAKAIPADGTIPNPRTLASIADRVAFLRKMVYDHSQAEDDILLPRLEQRVPGISGKYKDDHCDEKNLFQNLAKCLEELQCAGNEAECSSMVQRLHILTRTVRDEMVEHLDLEEEQMWPHVTKHFTPEEQSEILALIFGQMPCSRLRELLPWMIRMLSVSESNTMMNHILQVTQSTMFESWLKTWLPLNEENAATSVDAPARNDVQSEASASESGSTELPDCASTALMLLRGKDNIERTMRALAQDSSLSVENRTRMMQQVMLAPYNELRASALVEHRKQHNDKDDLTTTHVIDKKGNIRLGCKHYMRACKVRASCCNRLYTCRLCHDDAETTHTMDRTATTEILCMQCQTLQPVGAECVNDKCRKRFAKYFCQVCVFFDDADERSIYHCHSCNVCRVGKGLGQDYFHCMKCNQCMSMKYQQTGHVCVEKAMESDCPVCFQYLFTSTSPVKYLVCGHLMHTTCYNAYKYQCISCPVCSHSLEEMAPLYQQLDKRLSAEGRNDMPKEYRTARCDIYCLDCLKSSNTAYRFMYNKCPNCSSYNTRIDRVDANASDPDNESVGKRGRK